MVSKRNYPLLLISQFVSAFGDNAILAVIVGQLTYLHKAGALSGDQLRTQSTLYATLLFVPYVLLAPIAGYFNDRYAKTNGLVWGNTLKVFGALLCAFSLWGGHLWQGVGYFIIGIGATIYGPAKYGILPEILPRERLVKANGTVELLTLVAILGGAIAGAVMSDVFKDRVLVSFAIVVGIFALGLVLNFFMRATPNHPQVQLAQSVSSFTGHLRDLMRSSRLLRVLAGTALFWICGAAMKINFQPWGLEVLGLKDNTQIALLGLWLSIGVMIGSVLAGQWHPVGDLRRTRLYGFGIAVALGLVYTVHLAGFWKMPVLTLGSVQLIVPVIGLLIATGICAGLFLIPLNAVLQAESDPAKLGKTIAVQNLCDNLGMCLAGAYAFVSVKAGLSSSGVFLGLGLAIAAMMLWFRFPPASSAPSRKVT